MENEINFYDLDNEFECYCARTNGLNKNTEIDNVYDFIASEIFGFCTCANIEYVVKKLMNILELLETNKTFNEEDLIYLYELYKCGLTQHGGSVYGSWKTDDAVQLLKFYNKKINEEK